MQQTIVKTYKGSQEEASSQYRNDATKMAQKGYTPTSQVWAAGSYGCGSFIFALLLCFILIGILIFIYMLIVKPSGTLTVTYTLAASVQPEKTCPKCAESVKAAATVCRFCGHSFPNEPLYSAPKVQHVSQAPLSKAEEFGKKVGSFFAKKPPKR